MFRKLKRYWRDPYHEIGYDMLWRHPNWMPDKWYLKSYFKRTFGYELDLKHPKTFNEKLQWLKLYNRDPLYTTMVDKYRVKQWVADKIGEQYVIPTLAVYNSVNEIDLDKLPDQFVIKCNHDSGSVLICRDKSTFDVRFAQQSLGKALGKNYYWDAREWPYKNVSRCILAEKYMGDENGELKDYKFFCFNGEVQALFIASDRNNVNEETKFDFFDAEFTHLPFTNGHPNAVVLPTKPNRFEEMKLLASKLSGGIPQVRIDFYEVEDCVYFGEATFFHWGGFTAFFPKEWDRIFGDWIKLPTNGQ